MKRFRQLFTFLLAMALVIPFTASADAGILCNVRARVKARRVARANGERPILRTVANVATAPARALRARRAKVVARRYGSCSNNAGVPASAPAACGMRVGVSVEAPLSCPNGQCPAR